MHNRVMRNSISVIVMTLILGVLLPVTGMAQTEEPAYKIIEKDNDFEVRDYAPYLVAEVITEGDRDQAVNDGFRLLAAYIFGANTTRAKIEMTAPVTQSKSEKIEMTAPVMQSPETAGDPSRWVIRFMMPRSYRLDTLPKPNDERIALKSIPGRRIAALRFSGFWSESNLEAHRVRLLTLLQKKSLMPKGPATFAFYDPPWKPFFWRRNEILQEIDKR